jgi:putative endonuclease
MSDKRTMEYFVYIMTNHSRTLYTGVTNDLERRVIEHRTGNDNGFTTRYRMDQLIYFERFTNVNEAIAWEKRIKGWTRAKKIALIEEMNPGWYDLAGHLLNEERG